MWWYGSEGYMNGGWWMMPLFGLFCMITFMYVASRIFSSGGGFCGRHEQQGNQTNTDELRREIRELREDIKSLKENKD